MIYVEGKCPACGGRLHVVTPADRDIRSSLLVPLTARVECLDGCVDKDAAAKVLNLDHRHVVEWRDRTDDDEPGDDDDRSSSYRGGDPTPVDWSIEHPVTCRLDGKRILDCPVHGLVAEAEGIEERGRYFIELDDDSPWGFTTEEVPADG